MSVPKFNNMLETAVFVFNHHRLDDLLTNNQIDQFVEYLYNAADGETDLPTIVKNFFGRQTWEENQG